MEGLQWPYIQIVIFNYPDRLVTAPSARDIYFFCFALRLFKVSYLCVITFVETSRLATGTPPTYIITSDTSHNSAMTNIRVLLLRVDAITNQFFCVRTYLLLHTAKFRGMLQFELDPRDQPAHHEISLLACFFDGFLPHSAATVQ